MTGNPTALDATIVRLCEMRDEMAKLAASFDAASLVTSDKQTQGALNRLAHVFNEFARGISSIDATLPENVRREWGLG